MPAGRLRPVMTAPASPAEKQAPGLRILGIAEDRLAGALLFVAPIFFACKMPTAPAE